MITNERRQEIEREIVTHVVDEALKKKLQVTVWTGAASPDLSKSQDREKILAHLFETDVATVDLFGGEPPKNHGMIDFVYGNDGYDVISDYVITSITEELVASAQPLIDKYEKESFQVGG